MYVHSSIHYQMENIFRLPESMSYSVEIRFLTIFFMIYWSIDWFIN